MSGPHTMSRGIPKNHWRFRNVVSAVQLAVVASILVGAALWATTDGNGARVWDEYAAFSAQTSEWANTQVKMPWE
jgi:hypothetical protein